MGKKWAYSNCKFRAGQEASPSTGHPRLTSALLRCTWGASASHTAARRLRGTGSCRAGSGVSDEGYEERPYASRGHFQGEKQNCTCERWGNGGLRPWSPRTEYKPCILSCLPCLGSQRCQRPAYPHRHISLSGIFRQRHVQRLGRLALSCFS